MIELSSQAIVLKHLFRLVPFDPLTRRCEAAPRPALPFPSLDSGRIEPSSGRFQLESDPQTQRRSGCHLTDGIAAYSVMPNSIADARSTAAPGPVSDHNRRQPVPTGEQTLQKPIFSGIEMHFAIE